MADLCEAPEAAAAQPEAGGHPGEQSDGSSQPTEAQLYTLKGLEGQWTLRGLVELELARDPRLCKVRSTRLRTAAGR